MLVVHLLCLQGISTMLLTASVLNIMDILAMSYKCPGCEPFQAVHSICELILHSCMNTARNPILPNKCFILISSCCTVPVIHSSHCLLSVKLPGDVATYASISLCSVHKARESRLI